MSVDVMNRSVERVDGFDGELQVEMLHTIGLLMRTDNVVRIRAGNGLRNCGEGVFITDKLYTGIQQRTRDLYPERVQ